MPKRKTHPTVVLLVYAVGAVIVLLATMSRASAQVAIELITSANQPVPEISALGRKYKSWSLFLVCNPVWVLPQSESRLLALYENFQAFGAAIGLDHAAVWFRPTHSTDKGSLVDVLRSAAYCASLNLVPSDSPYVLITTEYPGAGTVNLFPDSFPKELKASAVIGLGGKNAEQISGVLTTLADRLVLNKMSNLDEQKEEWWRGLERGYEQLRASILGVSKGLTLRIKTPFFEVEKKS